MAKLRFLTSTILVNDNKVAHFKDEIDIKDEKLAEKLVKNGYAEPISKAKKIKKSPKKASKSKKNNEKIEENKVENDE